MAILKLSPFTTGMSGKMSNLTFSNTKEGTTMRERVTPKNPKTPAQLAVRAAFSKATKQWSTLNTLQLEAWADFADGYSNVQETSDKVYFSSPFNAFVKLTAKWYAVNASGTAPLTPPTSTFGGDNIKVTAAATAGGVKFTATGANSATVVTALLIAKLGGKNRKASAGQYREKVYINFKTAPYEASVTLPAGYYAAGYSFINTATGQESQPVLLGNVGPVTFAVSDGGAGKKKAA